MTRPPYRYRALLIANARFPEAAQELPELHGPPRDLAAVAEVLTDANVGLFDAADVIRLEDQPRSEISKQLERFFTETERDDVLLMYFSGHGRLDLLGKLYLCAQDTKPDLLWSTGIAFGSIDSLIAMSAAERVVIVLDCCHSGAFRSAGVSVTGRGYYLITSTRGVQLAADEDGLGQPSPFARQFVAAIREPGAPGPLSVPELYRRIYAGFELRGDQHPQLRFSGEGEFPIAWTSPAPSLAPLTQHLAPGKTRATEDSSILDPQVMQLHDLLGEASQLLQQVTDAEGYELLLLHLVRVMTAVNPVAAIKYVQGWGPWDQPLELLCATLAEELVRSDLDLAEQFAWSLIDRQHHLRQGAVTTTVVALAESAPDRAIALARAVFAPKDRIAAFIAIERAIAASQPRLANLLLADAEALLPQVELTERWEALIAVAERYVASDVARAAALLAEAERLAWADWGHRSTVDALSRVAAAFAAFHDRAESLTASILDLGGNAHESLGLVVAALARVDVLSAERLAYVIADREGRRDPGTVVALVNELTPTAPDLALRLVQGITNEDSERDAALGDLVTFWAPRDQDRAERAARAIADEEDRAAALFEVAAAFAPVDLARARHLVTEAGKLSSIGAEREELLANAAIAASLAATDSEAAMPYAKRGLYLYQHNNRMLRPDLIVALSQSFLSLDSDCGSELLDDAESVIEAFIFHSEEREDDDEMLARLRSIHEAEVVEGIRALALVSPERAETCARQIPQSLPLTRARALVIVAAAHLGQPHLCTFESSPIPLWLPWQFSCPQTCMEARQPVGRGQTQ